MSGGYWVFGELGSVHIPLLNYSVSLKGIPVLERPPMLPGSFGF